MPVNKQIGTIFLPVTGIGDVVDGITDPVYNSTWRKAALTLAKYPFARAKTGKSFSYWRLFS
jgi:hypothetical protein